MTSDTHKLIVGGTGSGKTITAKGMVENLLDQRRHLCIIDPTGVWYGLRTMADGVGPGFPIPIFGGDHGDVPVLCEQGEVVGSMIAGGLSAILDLSTMDSSDQQLFVNDLIATLRTKPRAHFHLIVDEADEFAPETPPSKVAQASRRQMEYIAKRGRTRGFVLTAITQRPADIAKAVISQVETVIAHRLIAPNDQQALAGWLKAHADRKTLERVMESLPALGTGERWIYSPQDGVLECGRSPMPRTFDSSRTPEPGETLAQPRTLAEIDLGAIRAALAPVESQKDTDAATDGNRLSDAERRELADLQGRLVAVEKAVESWRERYYEMARRLDAVREVVNDPAPQDMESQPALPAAPKRQAEGPPNTERPVSDKAGVTAGETVLPAAAQAMVAMLDRIAPARVTWASLAAMCGYKPRGGNFNAARKAMRESGLIVEDGDAVASAKPPASGMTREQARQLWREVLTSPAPEMIDALDVRPMSRVDLAAFLRKAPRGGHWNNGISQLLRNGVVVERGGVLSLAEPLPGASA